MSLYANDKSQGSDSTLRSASCKREWWMCQQVDSAVGLHGNGVCQLTQTLSEDGIKQHKRKLTPRFPFACDPGHSYRKVRCLSADAPPLPHPPAPHTRCAAPNPLCKEAEKRMFLQRRARRGKSTGCERHTHTCLCLESNKIQRACIMFVIESKQK
jgi:hypothetical protein